jgi:WD40 repeat protein
MLAYSPDGSQVAGADHRGNITLWDMSSHAVVRTGRVEQGSHISSIAFSPDAKLIAVAAGDQMLGEVILLDASTLEKRQSLQGHRAMVQAVAFSPDGRTLASASQDWSVKIWDLQKKTE